MIIIAPSSGILCKLEQAMGRATRCPQERCPFWEPGGAVVPAGCAFDRIPLPLDRQREAAELLLELKRGIERPASVEEARRARSRFYALLSEALEDE